MKILLHSIIRLIDFPHPVHAMVYAWDIIKISKDIRKEIHHWIGGIGDDDL